MKRLSGIFLFGVLCFTLSAQATGAGRAKQVLVPLTVESSVAGAMVKVGDAEMAAPAKFDLAAGTYTVTVTAKGFNDFSQTVELKEAVTITAALEAVAVAPTPAPEAVKEEPAPVAVKETPVATVAAVTRRGMQFGPMSSEDLKGELVAEHKVVSGDTLVGIAAKYLNDYRLWPIVWASNADIIANPEVIEKDQAVNVYKVPFNVGAYTEIEKTVIAEAYLYAYAAYVAAGSSWVNPRRWVLLEARKFRPDLFGAFADRIEEADVTWFENRK